jgi:hypothetical protein
MGTICAGGSCKSAERIKNASPVTNLNPVFDAERTEIVRQADDFRGRPGAFDRQQGIEGTVA